MIILFFKIQIILHEYSHLKNKALNNNINESLENLNSNIYNEKNNKGNLIINK